MDIIGSADTRKPYRIHYGHLQTQHTPGSHTQDAIYTTSNHEHHALCRVQATIQQIQWIPQVSMDNGDTREPYNRQYSQYQAQWIGVRTRYGDEIRIILKLRTCTFTWTRLGTSINDFSFFCERPFTWSPKLSPKWITRSRNTLRRWEKDHLEAKNMYFHLAYLGNRY